MTDTASRTGTAAGVLRGIFLMVLSVFLFASMDAMIKWASRDYPTGQIVSSATSGLRAGAPVLLARRQPDVVADAPLRRPSDPRPRRRHVSMFFFFLALGLCRSPTPSRSACPGRSS
jgi:drug/metabolite transporter (DMT)-like permease